MPQKLWRKRIEQDQVNALFSLTELEDTEVMKRLEEAHFKKCIFKCFSRRCCD